jgi:hypothetical protein
MATFTSFFGRINLHKWRKRRRSWCALDGWFFFSLSYRRPSSHLHVLNVLVSVHSTIPRRPCPSASFRFLLHQLWWNFSRLMSDWTSQKKSVCLLSAGLVFDLFFYEKKKKRIVWRLGATLMTWQKCSHLFPPEFIFVFKKKRKCFSRTNDASILPHLHWPTISFTCVFQVWRHQITKFNRSVSFF